MRFILVLDASSTKIKNITLSLERLNSLNSNSTSVQIVCWWHEEHFCWTKRSHYRVVSKGLVQRLKLCIFLHVKDCEFLSGKLDNASGKLWQDRADLWFLGPGFWSTDHLTLLRNYRLILIGPKPALQASSAITSHAGCFSSRQARGSNRSLSTNFRTKAIHFLHYLAEERV